MSYTDTRKKDQLINDLKAVITDTEELLKLTADHAGENAQALRARVSLRLNQAASELHHLQTVAMEQVKAASHATDEYVHENPWKSVGIATSVGLLMGLLLNRR
jgi:ElaB/YqjD/DUF883 family membrane-anchored ribosome-binding protein